MAGVSPPTVFTFSATGAPSATTRVGIGVGAGIAGQAGSQSIRFFARSTVSGATATIRVHFAFPDGSTAGANQGIIGFEEVSIVANAQRQNYANNAGDYVCVCTSASLANSFVDVGYICGDGAAAPAQVQVYLECTAISSGTFYVWAFPIRTGD